MNLVRFAKWLEKLPRLSLAVCALLLLVTVLVGFAIVAPFAYDRHGVDGILATLTAAVVCWVAASLALVSSALVRGQFAGFHAMLLGMFFRVGLPLAIGTYLTNRGGNLAEAGVFGLIVLFYLLTLAVEAPMSIALLPATGRETKGC